MLCMIEQLINLSELTLIDELKFIKSMLERISSKKLMVNWSNEKIDLYLS